MGNVSNCSTTPPSSYEAKAKDKDTKAYQWYGLHVLSAKCKGTDGMIYFDKEINILGIVVLVLIVLIVLWIVMKMMHKKQPDALEGLR